MYENRKTEGRDEAMLKAAFQEEKFRHAAELERRMMEKAMTYFVEENRHTLSGLTTFRAKCAETERLNQIYKMYPSALFENIRAWQNKKDYLLFEGARRIVPEKEFEETAREGEKLLLELCKIYLINTPK